jgi:hypothetical protein
VLQCYCFGTIHFKKTTGQNRVLHIVNRNFIQLGSLINVKIYIYINTLTDGGGEGVRYFRDKDHNNITWRTLMQ